MSYVIPGLAEDAVCVEACVDCNCCEAENDDCYEYVTYPHESLLPVLVAESDALECAPETMAEVESESHEPYEVSCYPDPASECCVEENIWIFSMLAHELVKLHLSPEVVEVESKDSENNDSDYKHVLCCPRLCFCLVCHCITLCAASLVVSV